MAKTIVDNIDSGDFRDDILRDLSINSITDLVYHCKYTDSMKKINAATILQIVPEHYLIKIKFKDASGNEIYTFLSLNNIDKPLDVLMQYEKEN